MNQIDGVKIDHIGYFVDDYEKARTFLTGLPGIGQWSEIRYDSWGNDELVIGKPYTIGVLSAPSSLGCDIEIIQPVPEKSEGSYFDEYIGRHGSGLHHIACSFDRFELLQAFMHEKIAEGGNVVHFGCGPVEMSPSVIDHFAVAYLQPGDRELILELICRIDESDISKVLNILA